MDKAQAKELIKSVLDNLRLTAAERDRLMAALELLSK